MGRMSLNAMAFALAMDLKLCIEIRTLHNYFIWLYGLPHVGFIFFSAGHFMLWVCHTAQAYYSEPLL